MGFGNFRCFFTLKLNIYYSREFIFIFPKFVHTNLTRRIDPRYPELQISNFEIFVFCAFLTVWPRNMSDFLKK